MSFSSAKVFEDVKWTATEKAGLSAFRTEVSRRVQKHGNSLHHLTLWSLAESVSIDLSLLPKDGVFTVALWVILLAELSRTMPEKDFKYPTFGDFQTAYGNKFEQESTEEQHNLWHTANWMNILFKIISAKKNKGLSMQVVPKLIEGWDAKYVTGSGQTRLTANRVFVFETEGDTKANHRGKGRSVRSQKRNIQADHEGKWQHGVVAPPRAQRTTSCDWYHPKRKRRRSISKKPEKETDEVVWVYNYESEPEVDSESEARNTVQEERAAAGNSQDEHPDFWEVVQSQQPHEWFAPKPSTVTQPQIHAAHRMNYNQTRPMSEVPNDEVDSMKRLRKDSLSSASAIHEHDHTDSDEIEDDDDMQLVFNAFAKPNMYRDESLFSPAHLDLMRSQSAFTGDFADELVGSVKSFSGVPKMEHTVSWSEIPVQYGNHYSNSGGSDLLPFLSNNNSGNNQVHQLLAGPMEWPGNYGHIRHTVHDNGAFANPFLPGQHQSDGGYPIDNSQNFSFVARHPAL